MAFNIIRQITMFSRRPVINKTLQRFYSIYEPDYLKLTQPKIPLCPTLNIQIKGYVYPLLESYQSFIHKLSEVLQFDVNNSWAYPPQQLKVQRFKTRTTVIEAEYDINIYERNMQISDISSTTYPILVRILEATLPEGVSLKIEYYDPQIEEKRFVPDKRLLDLKSELSDMQKP